MSAEVIDLDPEVDAMLVAAGLPVSDLSRNPSLSVLGVHDEGQLLGVVGIETHGREGLLRSLAVAPARRDTGVASSLVSDAERWAMVHGNSTPYLLTTEAAGFFARNGHETIARSEAPASIAATAQFKDLCPAPSTLMRKSFTAIESLQPRPHAGAAESKRYGIGT